MLGLHAIIYGKESNNTEFGERGQNMNEGNLITALTFEQRRMLCACQYFITNTDILEEKDPDKKQRKRQWLTEWEKLVVGSLKDELTRQKSGNNPKIECKLPISWQGEFEDNIHKLRSALEIRLPLYLIAMDTVLFMPYYPIDSNGQNKEYKGLKISSHDKIKEKLEYILGLFDINKEYIDKFKNAAKTATKGITGYWKKIAIFMGIGTVISAISGGFAAPAIGAWFAAAGLYGAAATSSGLAALGGTMAGGIAVITGTSAVLGVGTSLGIGTLCSISPFYALSDAVKYEIVMKEILLYTQKDIRAAQELIEEQRKEIYKLEEKLQYLSKNVIENKKQIENIKKSIEYLRKAANRNDDFLSKYRRVA